MRNITIHPISLEEIGEWDHVSVIKNIDNRVDALKEMYRIRAEGDGHINLILWDDPQHPSHQNLSKDILQGWDFDVYFDYTPIGESGIEFNRQIDQAFNEQEGFHDEGVVIDYSSGLIFDLQQAFPDSSLQMEASTGITKSGPITHADAAEEEVTRFFTTLLGDRTYISKNEEAVKEHFRWNIRDPNKANWYHPPEGLLMLICNENQSIIPLVHTLPFLFEEQDQMERMINTLDLKMPEL